MQSLSLTNARAECQARGALERGKATFRSLNRSNHNILVYNDDDDGDGGEDGSKDDNDNGDGNSDSRNEDEHEGEAGKNIKNLRTHFELALKSK